MIDDLIAQLDALGEDDFYYSPATTKAKINKAITALKSQAARIETLEAALRRLLTPQTPASFAGAMRVARAALPGGKE